MWDWFINHSTWTLLISAFILIALLIIRGRPQRKKTGAEVERVAPRHIKFWSPIFWTIEAILLGLIAMSLWATIVSHVGIGALITPEMAQGWLMEHASAIVFILLFGVALWYGLTRFLPPLMTRIMVHPIKGESLEGVKKRTDTLLNVFMTMGKVSIIIMIAFMVLSELNIPIAPVLAGFGIAGIAVGFGAQYLIRDIIAGVFILMENQYRVGDVAEVAGVSGLVEEVNLRRTVLRDLNGVVHYIPNGEIKVASNFTRHFSRVNLDVTVSYDTDLDRAIEVINRVCGEMANEERWAKVIRVKPRVLRVDSFGSLGVVIKILGEVKPGAQWEAMGELRLRVKKAFDVAGIKIPVAPYQIANE